MNITVHLIPMKLKLITLSALLICLGGATIAWSRSDFLRWDATQLVTNDVAPGRQFAYRLSFPYNDKDAVALEIRRVSSPRSANDVFGSGSANLRISRDDADMIISTALISSPSVHDELIASTCLIELEDILADTSTSGRWAIAGSVEIPDVRSKLAPAQDFCRGSILSTASERYPKWQDDEICIGRFRSGDEAQIYDYYCVVIARRSAKQ
jgi:hypothetical protein